MNEPGPVSEGDFISRSVELDPWPNWRYRPSAAWRRRDVNETKYDDDGVGGPRKPVRNTPPVSTTLEYPVRLDITVAHRDVLVDDLGWREEAFYFKDVTTRRYLGCFEGFAVEYEMRLLHERHPLTCSP